MSQYFNNKSLLYNVCIWNHPFSTVFFFIFCVGPMTPSAPPSAFISPMFGFVNINSSCKQILKLLPLLRIKKSLNVSLFSPTQFLIALVLPKSKGSCFDIQISISVFDLIEEFYDKLCWHT